VLGDRFGASCDGRLTRAAELAFRAEGFSVARNAPYAGGYVTRCYGVPRRGVHALQIEINRGLYMDEVRREPSAGFGRVQNSVTEALKAMRKAAWAILEH
jgi:N-formylglutamate amidohydrolase